MNTMIIRSLVQRAFAPSVIRASVNNVMFSSSDKKTGTSYATADALKALDLNMNSEVGSSSGSSSGNNSSSSSSVSSSSNRSAKLNVGLEKKTKAVLDVASQGVSEAACEDIMDDMNELLSSKHFLHFLRRGTTAAQVVEVVHVDINQDYSHVTAFWKSNFVDKFISFAAKEEGQETALKLRKRFTKAISSKLMDAEPRFRTSLMKTMSFRRVPRIFFKPISDRKQRINPASPQSSDQRQQLLREKGGF